MYNYLGGIYCGSKQRHVYYDFESDDFFLSDSKVRKGVTHKWKDSILRDINGFDSSWDFLYSGNNDIFSYDAYGLSLFKLDNSEHLNGISCILLASRFKDYNESTYNIAFSLGRDISLLKCGVPDGSLAMLIPSFDSTGIYLKSFVTKEIAYVMLIDRQFCSKILEMLRYIILVGDNANNKLYNLSKDGVVTIL